MININNMNGSEITTERKKNGMGMDEIIVMVRDTVHDEVMTPGRKTNRGLRSGYGLKQQLTWR